jgi:hypothetical protein
VAAVSGPDGPGGPACPRATLVLDVSGLVPAGESAGQEQREAGRVPGPLPEADLRLLAALARLRLAARRTGHQVRLSGACPALRALCELAGLAGEFEWEPEQREEVGGVKE